MGWDQVRLLIAGATIIGCMWGLIEWRVSVHASQKSHGGIDGMIDTLVVRQAIIMERQKNILDLLEGRR